ncbi:MAG: hypothetical protein ABIP95_10945 [Pelobium sp.]
MKNYLISFFFLFASFYSAENSFSAVKQNQTLAQTYIGKLDNKTDVVFSIKNSNGKLTGFYYYDKIGVEIKLSGTIVNGIATIFELDHQNKKQAKITGKLSNNDFTGKWESLSTKKSYALQLKLSPYAIPALPINLLGNYNTDCNLSISIAKNNGGYFYNFKSNTRTLKGKVTFGRSLEENLVYINFIGIKWAEDDGDISNELNADKSSGDLPTVVQGLITDEEIVIQNYGNAMNHYLKIGECDIKYLHLKKDK